MHSINITLLLLVMQINFFTSSHAKPVYHSSESKVLPDKSNPEAEDDEYKYFISRNESWREEEKKYVTDLPALIRPLWISALEYNESVGLEYVPVEGQVPVVGEDRLWIRTGRNLDRELYLGVEQKRDDAQDEEDGTVIDEKEEVWTTVEEMVEQWSEDGWTNEVLEGDEPKVVKWSKRETSVKDCLDKESDNEIGDDLTPLPEIEMDHGKDEMDYLTTVVPVTEDEGMVATVTVTIAPEELEADVERTTMVTEVKVTTEPSKVTKESGVKDTKDTTEPTEEFYVHEGTEAPPMEIGDEETVVITSPIPGKEDIGTIVPEELTPLPEIEMDHGKDDMDYLKTEAPATKEEEVVFIVTVTMAPEELEANEEKTTMFTEIKVTTEPSEVTKVSLTKDSSTEPTEEIIVHEGTVAPPMEIGDEETTVITSPIPGKEDIGTIVPEEPRTIGPEEITVHEVTGGPNMESEDEVGKQITGPSIEESDDLATVVPITQKVTMAKEEQETDVEITTIFTEIKATTEPSDVTKESGVKDSKDTSTKPTEEITVHEVTEEPPTESEDKVEKHITWPSTYQEIPKEDLTTNLPEMNGEGDNKDIQEITTKPTEGIPVQGITAGNVIEFGDEVDKKMIWPSYPEIDDLEDIFLRVKPLTYRGETMTPRQSASIPDITWKHPMVETSTQRPEDGLATDSSGMGSEDREEIGHARIPESSQTVEGMEEVLKEVPTVTSTIESMKEVTDLIPMVVGEPRPHNDNPEILSPISPGESRFVAPIEDIVPEFTPFEAKKMVGLSEEVQGDMNGVMEGDVQLTTASGDFQGETEESKRSLEEGSISEVKQSPGDTVILTTLHSNSPEIRSGEIKTTTASGNEYVPSETSTGQEISKGSVQESDISVQETEGSDKDSAIPERTPGDTSPDTLPETITEETEGSAQESKETNSEIEEDSTALGSDMTPFEEMKTSTASSSSIIPTTSAQEVSRGSVQESDIPAQETEGSEMDSVIPETITSEELNKDIIKETEGSVQESKVTETKIKEDSTALDSDVTPIEEMKTSTTSSSSILPETTAEEIPVTTPTTTVPNHTAKPVPAPPEDPPEPETTTPETESGASKSLLIHELIFVFSVLSWVFTVLQTA